MAAGLSLSLRSSSWVLLLALDVLLACVATLTVWSTWLIVSDDEFAGFIGAIGLGYLAPLLLAVSVLCWRMHRARRIATSEALAHAATWVAVAAVACMGYVLVAVRPGSEPVLWVGLLCLGAAFVLASSAVLVAAPAATT